MEFIEFNSFFKDELKIFYGKSADGFILMEIENKSGINLSNMILYLNFFSLLNLFWTAVFLERISESFFIKIIIFYERLVYLST